MQNQNDLQEETQWLFDEIGGEPLTGSDFEAEDSEPDFQPKEVIDTERQDSAEE